VDECKPLPSMVLKLRKLSRVNAISAARPMLRASIQQGLTLVHFQLNRSLF